MSYLKAYMYGGELKIETYEDLREAIFIALGAASTCWSNLETLGLFDSERCQEIGENLIAHIMEIAEFRQIVV